MKFMDAVRAQMRLTVPSGALLFLGLISLAPWAFRVGIYEAMSAAVDFQNDAMEADMLISAAGGLITFGLGLAWGLLVWRDEPPRARFYHWSLPVDTAVHDLSRVVARMIWLVAGLVLYEIVGIAVLTVYGVPLRLSAVGPMLWIALLGSGIIGFGFGAALSTAFERPIEIAFACYFALFVVTLVADIYRVDAVTRAIDATLNMGRTYSIAGAVARAGELASYRYRGIDPALSLPVLPPMLLWLTLSAASVVAASYWNRGRVR